ncbi:MAG: [acyl-carrier-protein] S-malonyltransferase [Crocinitomicaceae bacterium]|jgi:[acyl-carrier-protein] S-malonyltransferase|nr:[acyl-carrier-protein] S-malonyltransferase [Crocinitomicaceae bacterium]|tara:strand:- start:1001 stop:1888 length:888 start_codon:yes stop_codon:yes gene_type:complete
MKAYVFPGQGAQFSGMGKDLFEASEEAQKRFHQADEILGFSISETMFSGSDEDLKQTSVTQPAIFLHSVILAEMLGDSFTPNMVAGHSLGEFSALVAAGALQFEDGLKLVSERALAMQDACNANPSTMAAVLGMEDERVEEICSNTTGVVVAANYNCPGQLVISGEIDAVNAACAALTEAGARRALVLPVGGAFHSPLMESARERLSTAIAAAPIQVPRCPIIQNVTALPVTDPLEIRKNLIAQLTAPVKWTQSMSKMIEMGAEQAIEVGPGKVLQGLFKKVDRAFSVSGASIKS